MAGGGAGIGGEGDLGDELVAVVNLTKTLADGSDTAAAFSPGIDRFPYFRHLAAVTNGEILLW